MRRFLLAACCVLWANVVGMPALLAVTCWAQTTAIRPDQICPGGVCATPDVTWGPGAGGYQIGTTVPWRTDATATPTFTSADNAKSVLLTFNGAITATLPDATGALGDGTGLIIQTGPGTLTLNRQTSSLINGQTSITIGSYQSVSLASRTTNWYASYSLPQPSAQTGATVLQDNMTWAVPTGGAPAAIAYVGAADLTNNSGGGSPWVTPSSYTVGSGTSRFLTVSFQGDVVGGQDTITGVSYGGQAMTQMLKVTTGTAGTNRIAYLYGLPNPASGAHTVTFTWTGSAQYIIALIAEYSGVIQTTPACDGSGTNSAASPATTLGLTFTPTATGDWGIAFWGWACASGCTYTANNSYVQRSIGAAFTAPVRFDSNATIPAAITTVTATVTGTNLAVNGMICGLKHG